MLKFSRYFGPPLSEITKQAIQDVGLGLSSLNYRFMESCGGIPLRAWDMHGSKVVERLGLSSLHEEGSQPVPTLHLKHRGPSLSISHSRPTGLVNALLPFPLKAFLAEGQEASGLTLEVFPHEFALGLEALRAALSALEAKLQSSEIGIFFFEHADGVLPLISHWVRKRLIRVSLLVDLHEFQPLLEEGWDLHSPIWGKLGTSVSIVRIQRETTQEKISQYQELMTVAQRINTALTTPNGNFRWSVESLTQSEISL